MDETSSFPVPINSHLRFFICITWAFGKMPSHTAASSVPETATHLVGTQGSLHIALGLRHLHKLGGFPLGGSTEKWQEPDFWHFSLALPQTNVWIAASDTRGLAPELQSVIRQGWVGLHKNQPVFHTWITHGSPLHKPAAGCSCLWL